MPFITEEIYHLLRDRKDGDDLCIRQFENIRPFAAGILQKGELLKTVITAIRDTRIKNQVKPRDRCRLYIQTEMPEAYRSIEPILSKQVNAERIDYTGENVPNTLVVAVEQDRFFIKTEQAVDTAALKEELLKDLEHQNNFLHSVLKKLANDRFVQNAKPEVVALERKKKADAEARIRTIEETLEKLD
jgi:valyl-tRNA synthetase